MAGTTLLHLGSLLPQAGQLLSAVTEVLGCVTGTAEVKLLSVLAPLTDCMSSILPHLGIRTAPCGEDPT